MTAPNGLDAAFVVHQDVSPSRIERIVASSGMRRILVLTTHRLFKSELHSYAALAPEVCVRSCDEFLDDSSMAACDFQASDFARLTVGTRSGCYEEYVRIFQSESARLKNLRVCERVLHELRPREFFVADGLGVDARPWRQKGAKLLDALPLREKRPPLHLRIVRSAQASLSVLLPAAGPGSALPAVVLGSAKRIAIDDQVRRLDHAWYMAPVRRLEAFEAPVLRKQLARILSYAGQAGPYDLCTTIHQYSGHVSRLASRIGRGLKVVVDGHHPSNYPSSYLDAFDDCEFVADNHLSALWFANNGRRVVPAMWFQRASVFQPCRAQAITRVLLAINHAGDWSSLISRADTDRLIEAFVSTAADHPGKEFVIRLHPTMAIPQHEGVESMRRIARFIALSAPSNLSVSRSELDEDIEWCDLCVSEYSQVLIDAWRRGKLGLAANLTGRRSFMQDYEDIGFAGVAGFGAMSDWFANLDSDLERVVGEQNVAVDRFNMGQHRWISTRTLPTCD